MGTIRELYPHRSLRSLPPGAPNKIACFTLDFELDYGVRTGEFNILDHEEEIQELKRSLREEKIPLSLFVVTDILDRYPKSLAAARFLGEDWHSHSHTHGSGGFDAAAEFAQTSKSFRRHFGRAALGYRAPQGLLRPAEVPLLAAEGFGFSSSIFPSMRPGMYDHRRQPLTPMRYENGLLELPLGVIRRLRYTLSASYLKLLGAPLSRIGMKAFGVPEILVIDSHLHDLIVDSWSFAKLPLPLRAIYGIRKHQGRAGLVELARYLRAAGYTFLTMTDLFEICAKGIYQ